MYNYTNGTRWTFTWSNGRRLETASNGTNTISYNYTADGIRTSKTANGVTHTYYYSGNTLLREIYGSTTLDFFYDSNGTPAALKQNGNLYYYITNLQGDVIRIVDADGETVCEYQYDPYGNILSKTATEIRIEISSADDDSSDIFEDLKDLMEDMGNVDIPAEGEILELSVDIGHLNPLRYRGYYYDTETELYYLQSRYYDPVVGRFINSDEYTSTGQGILGHNMFVYCANDPISKTDTQGTTWTLAICGAAFNVAATYIAAKATGQSYTLDDGIAAALAGGLGTTKWWLGGLISGVYTGITAVKNGASATEAISCGIVAGITTVLSVGNVTNWTIHIDLGQTSKLINVVSDFIFGIANNSISAAIYKATVSNTTPKKQSVQSTHTTAKGNVSGGGKVRTSRYLLIK